MACVGDAETRLEEFVLACGLALVFLILLYFLLILSMWLSVSSAECPSHERVSIKL